MIRIEDKSLCCGCSACAAVCPHGAVVMESDRMGFPYPRVIEDKCVDCGLCEKVCEFGQGKIVGTEPLQCKAMRHNDVSQVEASRSGGVFPSLARKVIEVGGVVYGAAFDETFRVVHKRATDRESCMEFGGSKYVQSDMGEIFQSVKEDLQSGIKVLFSGTPCQAAAIASYIPSSLRKDLYIVDIVCHGVPSPAVWRSNLDYQRSRLGADITSLAFRDKALFGWTAHKESYSSEEKTITDDSYTFLFYRNLLLRDSCHVCPYASVKRVSDITLADFWGWEKVVPAMNADDKGLSAVLVNTPQGRELIDEVSCEFQSCDVKMNDCMQPNLLSPTPVSSSKEAFVRCYRDKGFDAAVKQFGRDSRNYKIEKFCNKLRRHIKRISRQ